MYSKTTMMGRIVNDIEAIETKDWKQIYQQYACGKPGPKREGWEHAHRFLGFYSGWHNGACYVELCKERRSYLIRRSDGKEIL